MNNKCEIHIFSEVAKSYDALIFDIWGVVYDGLNPYPQAAETINKLIADNKKILFLSNTPRPSYIAKENIKKWGINLENTIVYTSGDAVREQLTYWNDTIFENLGRNFYHIGAERNKDILKDMQVDLVSDISKADFVLLTAYADSDEEFNKFDDLFQKAIELDLPFICANPDVLVPEGNEYRRCAGAFGKKYEEMGGLVHYYGKPDPKVFNNLISKFLSNVPMNKILMVGDTLETDILGANRVGIDSALLLTGNGKNFFDPAHKAEIGAVPTYVCDGLY